MLFFFLKNIMARDDTNESNINYKKKKGKKEKSDTLKQTKYYLYFVFRVHNNREYPMET